MLASLYDQLLEIVRLRPSAIVVRCESEAVEDTYRSLLHALQPEPRSAESFDSGS